MKRGGCEDKALVRTSFFCMNTMALWISERYIMVLEVDPAAGLVLCKI